MLSVDEFWSVIELAGRSAPEAPAGEPAPAPWENPEGLAAALRSLSPDGIVQFAMRFSERMAAAYHWDLWGALAVIEGGAGDDTFEHFCAELVMLGRERFQAVLDDPETLADFEFPPVGIEGLISVPAGVYEDVTGSPFPYECVLEGVPFPGEPSGAAWDEHELPQQFPRLWARFGPE